MIFLRFDINLVMQVVNQALLPGVTAELFEVKSSALLTIDSLNTFVFENLRRPSKKQPENCPALAVLINDNHII